MVDNDSSSERFDLFLSHASEDKESFVNGLFEDLTKQGYRVFLDAVEINLGDSITQAINQALSHSKHGLIVFSENFLKKPWPLKELDALINKKINSEGFKILPILHNLDSDKFSNAVPLIADLNYAKSTDGNDEIIRKIMKSIGAPIAIVPDILNKVEAVEDDGSENKDQAQNLYKGLMDAKYDWFAAEDTEIVIGLVGTVGTKLNRFARDLKEKLTSYNDYEGHIIKVSENILSEFRRTISIEPKGNSKGSRRYNEFMDIGNELRARDPNMIGRGIVAKISEFHKATAGNPIPCPKKAFIIDSLKNVKEVEVLRSVYGNGFYLIGVHENIEHRKSYLIDHHGMSEEDAIALINRDSSESEDYGQHATNTYQLSDFFIDLNDDNLASATLDRILDLIFGYPFSSPTFGEFAMFMAFSSSLRSSDLSRQVGAVITKDNEILATGANDCPKVNGGLYWTEVDYSLKKYVDFKGGKDFTLGYDTNKKTFETIAKDVLISLGEDISEENVDKLRKSKLSDMTEYGRCVHAEMEAILSCVRKGISTIGATMYVTTFPCHNCAKHIVAAGIKNVIYIEPYPKSKTFEMYMDSVRSGEPEETENEYNEREVDKVLFIPYYGVAPRKFMEVFAMKCPPIADRKRKDLRGDAVTWSRSTAHIRSKMIPHNYLDMELFYSIDYLKAKEEMEDDENDG